MSGIPHERLYVEFFNGAIARDTLKKVPILVNPEEPCLVIATACGHASHAVNRWSHLWDRVTPLTQQYSNNGGGIVYDPCYARLGPQQELYHQAAVGQFCDFIDMAVDDGMIEPGGKVKMYIFFDAPCKVVRALDWTPQQFVRSSIRAKTHVKGFHPRGVSIEVGLLYYLGTPIRPDDETWYAPRCDMERYLQEFQQAHGTVEVA